MRRLLSILVPIALLCTGCPSIVNDLSWFIINLATLDDESIPPKARKPKPQPEQSNEAVETKKEKAQRYASPGLFKASVETKNFSTNETQSPESALRKSDSNYEAKKEAVLLIAPLPISDAIKEDILRQIASSPIFDAKAASKAEEQRSRATLSPRGYLASKTAATKENPARRKRNRNAKQGKNHKRSKKGR